MPADLPLRTSPTIDSFAFARAGRRMEGEVAVSQLPRLSELVAASDGELRYEIDGLIDDGGHPAANLHLQGQLNLICQRCNSPLQFGFDRTTRFRFVDSEEELNSLPIEDDEIEAVVGSRNMSVHDWVEDEAILSLPLVPRHDQCDAAVGSDEIASPVSALNPFAALLALRDDDDGNKRLN
ncbi:MAG: YceD family protein [Burkholderiaceae bacterium]